MPGTGIGTGVGRRRRAGGGAAAWTPAQFPGIALFASRSSSARRWEDSGRTSAAGPPHDPVRVWDDLSGSARHLVATSDADRGRINVAPLGAGKPALFIDGQAASPVYAPTGGVTYDRRDFTFWVSFVPTTETWEGALAYFGADDTTGMLLCNGGTLAGGDATLALYYRAPSDGNFTGPVIVPGAINHVVVRSSASGIQMTHMVGALDPVHTDSAELMTAGTSATVSIGSVRAPGCPVILVEAGLVGADVGADGRDQLLAYLASATLADQFPLDEPLLFLVGNSIAFGTGTSRTGNYYAKALAALPLARLAPHIRDTVGGAAWRSMAARFPVRVAPFYRAARPLNVLSNWEWINADYDTGYTDTAETNLAYARAYFQLWKDLGANTQAVLLGPIGWPHMGDRVGTIRTALLAEFTAATAHPHVWGRDPDGDWPADYFIDTFSLGTLSECTADNCADVDPAGGFYTHIDLPEDHQAIADAIAFAWGLLGVPVDVTPVNTAPPTVTGTAQVGATLTRHAGTWTHAPTITLLWQHADGSPAGNATDTGATYVPTEDDIGFSMVVLEIPNGDDGSAVASDPTDAVVAADTWTPADLSGLVAAPVISLMRAAGTIWQDDDETVPAVAHGDPIAVFYCTFTGLRFAAEASFARLLLNDKGGGNWTAISDGDNDGIFAAVTWPGGGTNGAQATRFVANHDPAIVIDINDGRASDYYSFGGQNYSNNFRASRANTFFAAPLDADPHTFCQVSGADYRGYVDNVLTGTTTTSPVTPTNIGLAHSVSPGGVVEIYGAIIDSDAWDDATRAQVHSYLAARS